jgi:ornithine cyclodeaminase
VKFFSSQDIIALTPYKALVPHLIDGLQSRCISPSRLELDVTGAGDALLVMPAWRPHGIVGVKLVTAYPNNNRIELPSISAVYVAFDAAHGQVLAMIDGLTLTTRRTAAASALAMSRLLSKKAQRLAIMGTGSLCLDLIEAHNSAFPFTKTVLWGLTLDKTIQRARQALERGFPTEAVADLTEAVRDADCIVCATTSRKPFIFQSDLKLGAHVSLVGAFTRGMAELDPQALPFVKLFADSREAVLDKGGRSLAGASGRAHPTIRYRNRVARYRSPSVQLQPDRNGHHGLEVRRLCRARPYHGRDDLERNVVGLDQVLPIIRTNCLGRDVVGAG